MDAGQAEDDLDAGLLERGDEQVGARGASRRGQDPGLRFAQAFEEPGDLLVVGSKPERALAGSERVGTRSVRASAWA